MLKILATYYPVLFIVFFYVMLVYTGYKFWKLDKNTIKRTDTSDIDKYINIKSSIVSETDVVDALKDEDIQYRGW